MPILEKRRQKIVDRLNELYDVLHKWEDKRDLSENPNELLRSEKEIKKIQEYIKKYNEELQGGIKVEEDQENPVVAPDVGKINRQWITGILLVILLISIGVISYKEITRVKPDYEKYMLWIAKGDSLLQENLFREAGGAYKQALAYNPNDTLIQKKLNLLDEANQLIESEDFASAKERIKVIINIPAAGGLAIKTSSGDSPSASKIEGIRLELSITAIGLEVRVSGGVPFDDPLNPYLIKGLEVCSQCVKWERTPDAFIAQITGVSEVEITLVIEDSRGSVAQKTIQNSPELRDGMVDKDTEELYESNEEPKTDKELFEEAKLNGDTFFERNEFPEAIKAYQAALKYNRSDKYCQDQIELCKQKIEDEELAAAKKIPFVRVVGGSFEMGFEDGYSNERPVHKVSLSPFRISQTEVTVSQYRVFCRLTGKAMPKEPSWGWKEDHPITNVSWPDALEYCKWVGGRLPTEAEWEYAARGGQNSSNTQYSGGNILASVAWYNNNTSTTQPAKSKAPNELGLYGMTGNAAEWCLDRYENKYYESSPEQNPMGPQSGSRRVVRGGSFLSTSRSANDGDQLRITYRNYKSSTNQENYIGFRVVKN
ncbi:MAG: SUMF1/EgtB/PvdO family nonheme iron enzyme [Bacteroidota bacterium]